MSQPGPVPAPGAGERWSVNMPAVIGVVFVFLVAVIVWVIATGGDGDGEAAATTDPPATAAPAALVTTTIPGATTTVSPTPLPATTLAPAATTIVSTTPPTSTTAPASTAPSTTVAPTTAPATTAAPTTAPPDDGDDDDAPAGDLGISGTPMRSPACDDDYITIIASAVGAQATAASVEAVLDGFPGSNYLRTDQTCPSLNPSVGGEPIYVVYFGPYDDDDDACDARSQGTSGSYVRQLSNSLGPDHSVTCG